MDICCLCRQRAILGESPVWSAVENAVYWIDIPGKKLHRTEPDTGRTRSWELPRLPGMIALRRRGGLVVALEDGLYGFDPGSGRFDPLVGLEADRPENRPNDGKCDAAGRLWVGTMNITDGSRPTGSLFRIDPDLTVTKIDSGLRVPNGLAWSPANDVMVHTDTRANVVWSYAFDAISGERSAKREFFRFDRDRSGGVDGAAMDAEGGYWTVLFGGGKLIRVTPDGRRDREISLPVSQPTMPAFGGADMRTIFITSAARNLDDEALKAQPCAGGLLALSVDVSGHEVYSFGG